MSLITSSELADLSACLDRWVGSGPGHQERSRLVAKMLGALEARQPERRPLTQGDYGPPPGTPGDASMGLTVDDARLFAGLLERCLEVESLPEDLRADILEAL